MRMKTDSVACCWEGWFWEGGATPRTNLSRLRDSCVGSAAPGLATEMGRHQGGMMIMNGTSMELFMPLFVPLVDAVPKVRLGIRKHRAGQPPELAASLTPAGTRKPAKFTTHSNEHAFYLTSACVGPLHPPGRWPASRYGRSGIWRTTPEETWPSKLPQ